MQHLSKFPVFETRQLREDGKAGSSSRGGREKASGQIQTWINRFIKRCLKYVSTGKFRRKNLL